ncbi:hypothetical protein HPP92_027202 [Vanilla planifolia]|uniref:mitogen-activated protein kinase kinase kinase n=1 Tax=Vanilla planifolia TaxID=51239 RepID=A0A835U6K6_VANPL|nr:hypothetical protein HPP92_027202 [Vanilla planifolia]
MRTTRSLDFSRTGYAEETSFRIEGSIDGEVDRLCRRIGLSGPEAFSIPDALWEATFKSRSTSELFRRSGLLLSDSLPKQQPKDPAPASDRLEETGDCAAVPIEESRVRTAAVETVLCEEVLTREEKMLNIPRSSPGNDDIGDGGLRGTRPPVLISPQPLPSVLSPPQRTVAPASVNPQVESRVALISDAERLGCRETEEVLVERSVIPLETADSFSKPSDEDSSSTTTEIVVSPNGRFKKKITSWIRGRRLGSGSFGTVYEGISNDGIFIAIKEVSLLDRGSSAQQCIDQLEHEIALLSQFEHENIVRYYGTDKEESKLFIFLERVSQGSLASLYQEYHLRDTQVSVYTRQILNGLNYLHERNVVHRDIKCANILVHANGSVKLADFGLAKEITDLNLLKSCKGSVYWMAPEVIHPKKTYGCPADIWSLGCTVLEMLTRQIPFPNAEWQHALYKIGHGVQPPIPADLSRDARDFIGQCVRVDPESRPTAAELLQHPFVRRPLT